MTLFRSKDRGRKRKLPEIKHYSLRERKVKKKEKREIEEKQEERKDVKKIKKEKKIRESPKKFKAMQSLITKETRIVGALIWCRFGRRMWPGMLIEGSLVGRPPSAVNTEWVFWFGEGTVSQMDASAMRPFIASFRDHYDPKYLTKSYERSIQEAVRVCAQRAGKCRSSASDLLEWAERGFRGSASGPLHDDKSIPEWISARLEKLKKWAQDISTDDDDDEEEEDEDGGDEEEEEEEEEEEADQRPLRSETYEKEKEIWDRVRDGSFSVTDVCISCGGTNEVTHCHPFFIGGHCASCKQDFEESLFLYGSDNISMYCAVCSNAGSMFICSQESCNRVFCHGCIRTLVNDDELSRVSDQATWNCYLCSPNQIIHRSLIQVQEDWYQQMIGLFFKEAGIKPMPKDWNVKRPLRVLSLFDGIGTGKLVLDLLGFEVEAYFASEVNPDCLRLTEVRHPAIKQLGDVTMLTAEKLVEIAPIDLVIGGSPCQDFSIVNPLRKGLMGDAGLLFFDFYRILNELQSLQQANRPLFFLYENVASMNKETKAVMTRFFKRQPNVWDAINFTAQRRKRYFWGNIPGLKGGECVDDEDVTELKEVLMPGRKARMSKVRCVTSRSNSLRQSKHNHKQFPVAMGNHLDTLWIPELERLFLEIYF